MAGLKDFILEKLQDGIWDVLEDFVDNPVVETLMPQTLDSGVVKGMLGELLSLSSRVDNTEIQRSEIATANYNVKTKVLTRIYHQIEETYGSCFEMLNFQSNISSGLSLHEKRMLFQWADDPDYPPHLNGSPDLSEPRLKVYEEEYHVSLDKIFGIAPLAQVFPLIVAQKAPSELLRKAVDLSVGDFEPTTSISEVEENNHRLRMMKKSIYSQKNIGDRKDWYTDAVFAQQQFTGTNPTTIELASTTWIGRFKQAADSQNNHFVSGVLSAASESNNSLYIQDCSYFREAVFGSNHAPDEPMEVRNGKDDRHCCASVSLFHLRGDGKLHLLGVVIDWKGSIEKSVTIFNKRVRPEDKSDQAADWPWRYAKTCAQSADWLRHEVAVHLVNTHLVEEVIIVAAHRTLPPRHLLFRLLEPHWLKTLSLNAAARDTLVPSVVIPIIGLNQEQALRFIRYSFDNFHFTEQYVPNDLRKRGFPPDRLDNVKFHNYAYARNMHCMWSALRGFVSSYLLNDGRGITSDVQVRQDSYIQAWCREIRGPGKLVTFPEIKTMDELIDAATMCIHIASPQHTAVNYLQEYYQSFVINKPPSLCSPPPTALSVLQAYREHDLVDALPMDRAQDWLLASHIPHLLSQRVAQDQSLITYAVSAYHMAEMSGDKGIKDAAETLCRRLWDFGWSRSARDPRRKYPGIFTRHADDVDDCGETPYRVMDPARTAVSILI